LNLASAWLQAFNQENWGAFTSRLHPEIVFTQRTHHTVDTGLEEVFTSLNDRRGVDTNLHGQIIGGFGSENRAVLEVHWTGLRNGEVVDFTPVFCSEPWREVSGNHRLLLGFIPVARHREIDNGN
jgi:hypothetical protein